MALRQNHLPQMAMCQKKALEMLKFRPLGERLSWKWDPKRFRYQSSQGRFVDQLEMLALRDAFIQAAKARAEKLAEQVEQPGWVEEVRELIKELYIDLYCLGRGGRNAMTFADWGRIGAMLQEQYRYLNQFAADIVAGKLSLAQIKARLQLYISSAIQAFEKGKAYGMGLPTLPAYPGDGTSECLVNCRCSWFITAQPMEWQCTWMLGIAEEHCPTCLKRSQEWNPYRIPRF